MSFLYKELPPQARGDTWSFTFLIQDINGDSLDITGNQYWFTVKSDVEALDVNAEIQVGPVTPTDAVNGEVTITIPFGDTGSLVTGIAYNYDLQEVSSTGEVTTLIIGKVKVTSDITRYTPTITTVTVLSLDGVSGSYLSTGGSPAFPTGSCILYGYVEPVDNTPLGLTTILSKYLSGGSQRSLIFSVDQTPITGALQVNLSADGVSAPARSSTVATGVADGVGYWPFAVIDIGNEITFWVSLSPPTATPEVAFANATQVGDPVPIVETEIFDSTSLFEVGSYDNGVNGNFNGLIHRAGIIDGILPQGLGFGEELITNGTFDSNISSWVPSGIDESTIVFNSGEIELGGNSAASQAISTTIGATYSVSCAVSRTDVTAQIRAGLTAGSFELLNDTITIGANTSTFTAASTTTFISIKQNGVPGATTDLVRVDNISVTPTAQIAVDLPLQNAGNLSGTDTFFGAEMLKPSARTVNATDWVPSGTGTITNNGDGTVTLDDQDLDSFQYGLSVISAAGNTESRRATITLSAGTAAETRLFLQYKTGGTTTQGNVIISWADPLNPVFANGMTGSVIDNGDDSYTFTVEATNNGTGNTEGVFTIYVAGSDVSATGTINVHGLVSIESEWTLNGNAETIEQTIIQ